MLSSRTIVTSLLRKHRLRPSKRLGQNFLIDEKVIQNILHAAHLQKDDVILEIGPGIGVLTRALCKKVSKVIAIEKDRAMVNILKETLKECENVAIILGDALKIDVPVYPHYKIVASLPYSIVAPIIRKFLESRNPPQQMVLVVQKEVAQKICAHQKKMNLLAVSVQVYAAPEIISFISKKSFFPQPNVDGAILTITPHPRAARKQIAIPLFFKIVKAGFSHPRKQLINNLSKGLQLNKEQATLLLQRNGIHPTQRAETLTISQWIQLTKTL